MYNVYHVYCMHINSHIDIYLSLQTKTLHPQVPHLGDEAFGARLGRLGVPSSLMLPSPLDQDGSEHSDTRHPSSFYVDCRLYRPTYEEAEWRGLPWNNRHECL